MNVDADAFPAAESPLHQSWSLSRGAASSGRLSVSAGPSLLT
jgi:hypothetical protein